MKASCKTVKGNQALFCFDGEIPKEGKSYIIEEFSEGTQAQNKAFHSLLSAFYYWMKRTDQFEFEDGSAVYDLRVPTQEDFREFFKFRYGAGASHYQYVDNRMAMQKVKTADEVPQYAVDDFNAGNHGRVKAVLKSWSDYSRKQRKEAIDNLFMLIRISQCDDKKVHEIMTGMEGGTN